MYLNLCVYLQNSCLAKCDYVNKLLCYGMLCYSMLCYSVCAMRSYPMLCYVTCMLCYAMPCRAVPCRAMPCHATLCYVMLCYVMLCYVMLCYVMLCYVMLCYVMLCYVMLCYVMLCYVMLLMCTSRKSSYPPRGGSLEILGGTGSQKPKFLKESMKQNWNFQRHGVKPINPVYEGNGYILELLFSVNLEGSMFCRKPCKVHH